MEKANKEMNCGSLSSFVSGFDGKWKSRAGLSTRIVTIFAARCRTENISRSPTIKQIKTQEVHYLHCVEILFCNQ
ncbi:uncharacterized protein PHALS_11770 [Plasmopara halstedii]|uniref:Uncharacterized protein n=1 Tax=Plasmopara halstedii TaxID=4781 RepID=A0A0P1AJY5_PLAHL|nr:uncharacterized protein PHALS_11770 [Plasmopara halstedii]CEG41422.1 hypothetical protein PHALS_11770 [Plasmopara halstedii]|eukprot:XP_024577791.1 hypothetical protein PHALS_11770 [Plasmopara halstedii]